MTKIEMVPMKCVQCRRLWCGTREAISLASWCPHCGGISDQLYREQDRGWVTKCWIWTGSLNNFGYARVGSSQDQHRYGHRWMYELAREPIPTGLTLDHLCRVPACINPDHLEPVTHAENLRRGAGCKLTYEDVVAIRESSDKHRVIGERFGISSSHVSRIKSGQKWAAA